MGGVPVAGIVDYALGAPMPGDATQVLPRADVLEFQLVVFRAGNHGIGTGTKGAFPVGLFSGKNHRQDIGVADFVGNLIRIHGQDVFHFSTCPERVVD